jgi:hypothetical protein
MAHFKLKIIEYFDFLVNKLDLAVETLAQQISDDQEFISGLNKQRDAFLAEINHVHDFNLRALSQKVIKPGQELGHEDLFTRFCFFIEHVQKHNKYRNLFHKELENICLRLIITDKYILRKAKSNAMKELTICKIILK